MALPIQRYMDYMEAKQMYWDIGSFYNKLHIRY